MEDFPLFDPNSVFKLETLGNGGFGTVEKTYHKKLQKYVALKFLNISVDKKEIFAQALVENKLLQKIEKLRQHQANLPFLTYYGIYKDPSNIPVFQMENGITTLFHVLQQGRKYNCGEILYILKVLVEGFAILQKNGIANRDVKTENIILVEDEKEEGQCLYKISDFGIGCHLSGPNQNQLISCQGIAGITQSFAAPEILRLFQELQKDENFSELYNPFVADVYSLGILILKLMDNKHNNKKVKEIFLNKDVYFVRYELMIEILEPMLEEDPTKRIDFTKLKDKLIEMEKKYSFNEKPKDEIQYYHMIIEKKEEEMCTTDKIYELYQEHKQLYEVYIIKVSRLKEAKYHLELAFKHLKRLKRKNHESKLKLLNINLMEEKIEILAYFGDLSIKLGDLEEAKKYLEDGLRLCKKLQCPTEIHKSFGLIYFFIGSLYDNKGTFDKAYEFYKKSLEIKKTLFGEENSEVANSYSSLGSLYENKGDFKNAEDFFKRSLEIRLNLYGNEHVDTADSFCSLGLLYDDMESFQEAENFQRKSLEIRLNLYGESHDLTAFCYNNLGLLFKHKGDLKQALEFYGKSLQIRKNLYGEKNANVAQCYNNLGGLYDDLRDLEKSEECYKKCIEIYEELYTKNHSDTACAYNNIGMFYFNVGNFEQAETFYKTALDIRLKVVGENHGDSAISYCNLGALYDKLGTIDKAEECYINSLKIRKNLHEDNCSTALCYCNLGAIYEKNGDLEKSEEFYKESLEIRKKNLGENNPETAFTFNCLGNLYFKLGNIDKAQEFYEISLKIRLDLFGEIHPELAKLYNNLGSLFMKKGDFQKAQEYYNKALDIYKKLFGEKHKSVAVCFENIGKLFSAMGEIEKAKEFYELSKGIINNIER